MRLPMKLLVLSVGLSLALAASGTAQTPKPLLEEKERVGTGPNLRGLTVLVVDDEPDAREIISTMLEQYGADVKSAGSVSQAFDILLHGSPHVLVSDIGMPENDGYELIRQIRSRGIQIPAVAVTAHAMIEDRLRALSAGYQVHVAKPVDSVELGIVVASLAGLAKRS